MKLVRLPIGAGRLKPKLEEDGFTSSNVSLAIFICYDYFADPSNSPYLDSFGKVVVKRLRSEMGRRGRRRGERDFR